MLLTLEKIGSVDTISWSHVTLAHLKRDFTCLFSGKRMIIFASCVVFSKVLRTTLSRRKARYGCALAGFTLSYTVQCHVLSACPRDVNYDGGKRGICIGSPKGVTSTSEGSKKYRFLAGIMSSKP